MSLEMCFWQVSDEQLSSFRHRRGAFMAFSESAPCASGVVDHRNVRVFHFLLNGTEKRASGPSRIFQTWFDPSGCDDIHVDDLAFGMDSANTQELLVRLKALSNEEIRARERLYGEILARRERFLFWRRRRRAQMAAPIDDDDTYLEDCFANLREICERAVASKCGLIWSPG